MDKKNKKVVELMKIYVYVRNVADHFKPIALVIRQTENGEEILKSDGTWENTIGAIALRDEHKHEVKTE